MGKPPKPASPSIQVAGSFRLKVAVAFFAQRNLPILTHNEDYSLSTFGLVDILAGPSHLFTQRRGV